MFIQNGQRIVEKMMVASKIGRSILLTGAAKLYFNVFLVGQVFGYIKYEFGSLGYYKGILNMNLLSVIQQIYC